MNIILRLICEKLSRIAVKISFLWGREYGEYATASFAASVKISRESDVTVLRPLGIPNFNRCTERER